MIDMFCFNVSVNHTDNIPVIDTLIHSYLIYG